MNEFENLMNTIEFLEARLELLEEEVMSPEAGEDRNNIYQEMDSISRELEKHNANLKDAMKEIIDNEIEIDNLTLSIENAKRTVELLEEDAMSPEAGEDVINIRQGIDNLEREIEEWEAQLAKLPRKLSDRAQDLENQIARAEREVEILQEDAMSPEAGEDRTNIYQEIADLENQIEKWKKELTSIRRILKFVDRYRDDKTTTRIVEDPIQEPEQGIKEDKEEPVHKSEEKETTTSSKVEPTGKKVYDWHPELTPEQKDELIAEGIEPGDPEYFLALRNYGIRDNGPVRDDKDGIQPEEKKTGKKVYDWHPELTPEQKDELIAEGIEPGDPEYFLSLRNYGIKDDGPFHYEDNEKNKEDNSKDKEDDDGTIIDIYPTPPPIKEDKTETAIEKTGLQVFREQFNEMPPIENKHTLSERLPLIQTLGTVAGVGLLSVNPFVGIPVAVASVISKPIAYRLTGQKALEEDITAQFLDLAEKNPKEFEKMIDYLSEEKIQDLKPNAVILNALHKTMLKVTKDKAEKLEAEMETLTQQRDELLNKAELTPAEEQKLGEINARVKEIDEKEAPTTERRLKDIKRGKDRISQRYKGNIATRFNIFAHRNTNSEEYGKVINEYANAEKSRDENTMLGKHKEAGESAKRMEDIMKENTYTNLLGVHKGIFNARNKVVRIMSDKIDNTLKHIAILGTALTGAILTDRNMNELANAAEHNKTEGLRIAKEHNKLVDDIQNGLSGNNAILDQKQGQLIADGEVSDIAARLETGVLHEVGSTSNPNYLGLDANTQKAVETAKGDSTITGGKVSEILEQIADIKAKYGVSAAQSVEKAAQDAANNTWVNDHSVQLGAQGNAGQQMQAEADLYSKLAGFVKTVGNAGKATPNLVNAVKSYLGPIVSAVAVGLGIGKDVVDNKREDNHNKEVEINSEGR